MRLRSPLIIATILSVLIVPLFVNLGIAVEKRRAFSLRGKGLVFHFSEEIYWSEEKYNHEYKRYSQNKKKYLEDFIGSFSSNYLSSDLEATDWSISFNCQYSLENKETLYYMLVQCKINGAASGTAESPYFRTEWLLIPLLGNRIDLYGFTYLTDEMLVYEGEVNHISTKITFTFPRPISHCHYHIWYR